ncbi:MmpS family transport accessory protein [[Mycobacterium] kokjensenii]|uniref:MmpS family transport accessory protein n=1 Tax=[Mycobacterium] kokjensenii TaxID=3064287 RepID=A0ABM9LWX1_9MYCO|nr:MmpS family transport accessory protein [Mycolicibacter sp. MU0083]CAJ1506086.1 MmpS family transport accessory protein [Mycolicibacter sp. MU0083]
MFGLVKRFWIPLLLVVVVALGSYVVVRVRDSFGVGVRVEASDANADETKPFNPKYITYELTSPDGGTVNINFLDENGQPHLVEDAPLPWSHTIVTTLPSMSANIVAQGDTGMNHLRCRVIVDDKVRDDRSIDEYKPFIYCLVKSV